MNSAAHPLSRRRFVGQCTLLPFLPTFLRAAMNPTDESHRGPLFGIQAPLAQASEMKAAGFDFLTEGVGNVLVPDAPEEDFLVKLKALQAAAIPVLSCNSFIRPAHFHCVGPEANHDAILKYADIIFKRAGRAGVQSITFGSAGARKLPDGFPVAEAKAQFAELLRRMGPLAEAAGVLVSVESLRRAEDNFLYRLGYVTEVVSAARHPAVRIAADLYHITTEGDTPEDLAAALPYLGGVELAEKDGRTMPGKKGQDFRPYFSILKKAGYSGRICFEGLWKPEDAEPGARELRRQWAEA